MKKLVLILLLCLIAPVHAVPLDARAQEVFTAVKDRVVQIRTLLKGSQSQTSIGSGFYVSDTGLVMTNYHVVSSFAMNPKNYSMEYVAAGDEHGELTLLAVDVRHDLALLQRTGSGMPYLRFHADSVVKGEKLFSLGNPNDLGQVIVEGVNNGLREHSFYDEIHFTGAINSGMSGGPVVNRAGELVGVNVASMGQSRGFLVPAQFAAALLARWYAHPVLIPKFRVEIARQLKAHSAALVAKLTEKPFPVQLDAGYAIPDAAAAYMRCWGNEEDKVKMFHRTRSYFCSGRSGVYVEDGIELGSVFFENVLYQNLEMDRFRFAKVLERSYSEQSEGRNDVSGEQLSKYACNHSQVELKGMPVKAVLCLRAYRKFPELYDMKLKIVTLRGTKYALVSKLDLNGLGYEDGMRFVKFYLGALK